MSRALLGLRPAREALRLAARPSSTLRPLLARSVSSNPGGMPVREMLVRNLRVSVCGSRPASAVWYKMWARLWLRVMPASPVVVPHCGPGHGQ